MKYEIAGNPDQGDLTVGLEAGETILTESGAMSRMSAHMEVNARLIGGFVKAVARKLLGGESLFLSEYQAAEAGFVSISPKLPGSIAVRELRGETFYLTSGSFLACTPGVELSTRFGGLRAFFSGEGGFLIECTGTGTLFFNSYGAIVEKDVNGALTVDTGHVVAFEPTLDYQIRGMGGLKQTVFSGEGLVMAFEGSGKIYVQTRVVQGLVKWLRPFCR
ncbi:MAG: TIGR00266 family protein [Candidatus Nealsonbacteria bacterium]|nr:TIGR00266 family protein [Candidatus Nealsonbacteria bacterium]